MIKMKKRLWITLLLVLMGLNTFLPCSAATPEFNVVPGDKIAYSISYFAESVSTTNITEYTSFEILSIENNNNITMKMDTYNDPEFSTFNRSLVLSEYYSGDYTDDAICFILWKGFQPRIYLSAVEFCIEKRVFDSWARSWGGPKYPDTSVAGEALSTYGFTFSGVCEFYNDYIEADITMNMEYTAKYATTGITLFLHRSKEVIFNFDNGTRTNLNSSMMFSILPEFSTAEGADQDPDSAGRITAYPGIIITAVMGIFVGMIVYRKRAVASRQLP